MLSTFRSELSANPERHIAKPLISHRRQCQVSPRLSEDSQLINQSRAKKKALECLRWTCEWFYLCLFSQTSRRSMKESLIIRLTQHSVCLFRILRHLGWFVGSAQLRHAIKSISGFYLDGTSRKLRRSSRSLPDE